MRRERTALIVEIAMAVALAAVLGLVRVFRMPQGGSVSLEMLPILYLGLRRGSAVGMVTGAVYGFVQLVTDPYVAHPIQFMLDYPVAYTLVGLAGLVPSRPVLGVAMGTLGRLAIHTCSGAIFLRLMPGKAGMLGPIRWYTTSPISYRRLSSARLPSP